MDRRPFIRFLRPGRHHSDAGPRGWIHLPDQRAQGPRCRHQSRDRTTGMRIGAEWYGSGMRPLEYIADGSVTADLGKFGLQLPTASSAPSVNLGAEYRSESYTYKPDYIYENGLASGGSGPTAPIDAGFHVVEVFTEGRLPLLSNLPGVYDLSMDAGYRYSSYTTGFDTNTYKFGVEYA